MTSQPQSTNPQQNYLRYQQELATLSDDDLLERKRKGKTNPGWTSSRGAYERALSKEIAMRGLKLPKNVV